MDILQIIADELNVKYKQVENAVNLIDEGNTIPFIARYRKEVTGGLSDEDLERWMEYQSDQYDYSFERGKDAVNQYFSATFKGTD